MPVTILLLLQEGTAHLVRRGVGVHHVRLPNLGEYQNWWINKEGLQRVEGLRLLLRRRNLPKVGKAVLRQHNVERTRNMREVLGKPSVHVTAAKERAHLRRRLREDRLRNGFGRFRSDRQPTWEYHMSQVVHPVLEEMALGQLQGYPGCTKQSEDLIYLLQMILPRAGEDDNII